jgi:hypothetical protein
MPGYCFGTKSMAGYCQRCKKPIFQLPAQQVEMQIHSGLKKLISPVS